MGAGKAILLALGAMGALAGLALTSIGGMLLWADATQRDADGFYTSGEVRLATDQYALTTEDLDLGSNPGDWFFDEGQLTFRVTVNPATDGEEVFVGIAAEEDVEDYLGGVAHERIRSIDPGGVDYDARAGEQSPVPPSAVGIWVASAEGPGPTTLTWDAEQGSWRMVVMDAEGAPGVAVTATGAVRFDLVDELATGLLIGGLAALAVAIGLLVAATLFRESPTPAVVTEERPGHPVLLEGRLEEGLSRGLPLVKWVLVIPHAIVLAFLWAAFVLLTVVAGVAILFTGRYPRGVFDFNVGVLRWTWRVLFYSYGALGTDRYPPFSLRDDPDYPARFDVRHPGELSRGLVLVKWWLLAIPHYLVVGLLTTGLFAWSTQVGDVDGAETVFSMGLIDVLVVIVAGSLLFAGRYPRGLFDLVVGLQRWVFRVGAYAALMTDQYPPFRLDMGGSDPSGAPPAPQPGTGDQAAAPPPSPDAPVDQPRPIG